MAAPKMIQHTAVFSDGTKAVRNFRKVLPYGVRSVNTQTRANGTVLVQTLVGFSSVNAAKNLFGKMSGSTVNEVVPATHTRL